MIVKIIKEFDADVSGYTSEYVRLTSLSKEFAKKDMMQEIKDGLDAEDFIYEAHPELPSDYEIDQDFKAQKLFDVVLMETELEDGLDVANISKMISCLKNNQVFPLDIQAEYSGAIGFITAEASEKLDYCHENIETFIKPILEDMKKESISGEYELNGMHILLKRNF